MIWGWQDELDRVPDLVEWSQDYSLILCLPICDPVPKPRVMLKALHRQDVDMICRFMPLSLFPGNAIWHRDDIEQMTAVQHESDAEGEDADMQVQDSEFLLVDTADQVPGTKFDQSGRVQVHHQQFAMAPRSARKSACVYLGLWRGVHVSPAPLLGCWSWSP